MKKNEAARMAKHFRKVALAFLRDKGHKPAELNGNNPLLIKLLRSHMAFPESASKQTIYKVTMDLMAQLRAGKPIRKPPSKPLSRISFYETDEWRHVRYFALKAAKGLCQCCGSRPSLGKPLHVDHIKPRSKYPELELDKDNLQVLCLDCNLGKSNKDQTDWRSV